MKKIWVTGLIASTVGLMSTAAYATGPDFASDGTIAICTSANFPPMTFKKDAGDSDPIGIDIDIAEALAKAWGAKATFTTTEFAGLLPTLGSGRCDMIISGIYINDERRKTYNAVPYMRSATVLVTSASNSEVSSPEALSGKTVALESGTYYEGDRITPLNQELEAAGKPKVVVQNYPTQQAAYQQVLVGRVDATLTEEAEGAYRVATTKDQLKITYTWQSDFKYGVYFRPSDADLQAIKATFETLRSQGFFKSLAEKYGLNQAVFDVDYGS